MTTHGDPDSEFLEPGLDPREREELSAIAQRLRYERPVPRLAFVAALRKALIGTEPEAPQRAQRLIAAYAGSGLILLALAALGIAGAGPLAAG